MAQLNYNNKTIVDPAEIAKVMENEGLKYESWGLRVSEGYPSEKILEAYDPDVQKLMEERGYVSVDMVALDRSNPQLEVISAKFDKEHHHLDDEVRFTVEGEGVFEIEGKNKGSWLKFTAEPGDLIVIPANRRHLFYLTEQKKIRCIRLFKSKEGWEAIYQLHS